RSVCRGEGRAWVMHLPCPARGAAVATMRWSPSSVPSHRRALAAHRRRRAAVPGSSFDFAGVGSAWEPVGTAVLLRRRWGGLAGRHAPSALGPAGLEQPLHELLPL